MEFKNETLRDTENLECGCLSAEIYVSNKRADAIRTVAKYELRITGLVRNAETENLLGSFASEQSRTLWVARTFCEF